MLELYLYGAAFALFGCAAFTYFDDGDVKVGDVIAIAAFTLLSWLAVILMVSYLFAHELPLYLKTKVDWKKVVWKRKK